MSLYFFNRYFWPDLSATSQILTDLAIELARRGHKVTVIASRQRLDIDGELLPLRASHEGVEIHRVRASTFGRGRLLGRALDYLTYYLAAAWFVLCHVRRGDTVVAKTDPPVLGAILMPVVWLKRARLVNWMQDVYPEVAVRLGVLGERSPVTRLLGRMRDASLRAAAFNVVIGERMHGLLAKRAAGASFHVIHNWSSPLEYEPVPGPDNPYRLEHGLRDRVVFCYSGNLGRAHRFESLLQVGQRLRNRRDVHFLIIGGGAQYEDVREGAQRRGMLNWTFLPYQSRELLGRSLGAADVHLVSLDPELEGLIVPSKIYGVLAAGRPTVNIGAAEGEIAGILKAHDCGISVEPEDVGALEKAISSLASDAKLRQRMGQNARAASEGAFGFRGAADRWWELLGGSSRGDAGPN